MVLLGDFIKRDVRSKTLKCKVVQGTNYHYDAHCYNET
jgi:hypothetical protein